MGEGGGRRTGEARDAARRLARAPKVLRTGYSPAAVNRRTFLGAAAATAVIVSVPRTGIGAVQARADRLSVLTPRYRQVLQLMAQGLTNQEISRALQISRSTVNHHVHRIVVAFNAETRAAAIQAFRGG